jgi:hypothetical protein
MPLHETLRALGYYSRPSSTAGKRDIYSRDRDEWVGCFNSQEAWDFIRPELGKK